jgi:hypothetical protein
MDLGCLGLTPAEGTTPGGVTQRSWGREEEKTCSSYTKLYIFLTNV